MFLKIFYIGPHCATSLAHAIIELHNTIMFFLVFICFFVTFILAYICITFRSSAPVFSLLNLNISNFYRFNHHTLLEILWTIGPAVILYFIAVPSFSLLYKLDTFLEPDLTVHVIGAQWFWTYEVNYNAFVMHPGNPSWKITNEPNFKTYADMIDWLDMCHTTRSVSYGYPGWEVSILKHRTITYFNDGGYYKNVFILSRNDFPAELRSFAIWWGDHMVERTGSRSLSDLRTQYRIPRLCFLKRLEKLVDLQVFRNVFDSRMISNDLAMHYTQTRLMSVDNILQLPIEKEIRFSITSADVLHSYSMPALGIKCDASPSRLNIAHSFIKVFGTYFGRCSEICGVQHGFMSTAIEALPLLEILCDDFKSDTLTETKIPEFYPGFIHPDEVYEKFYSVSEKKGTNENEDPEASYWEITVDKIGKYLLKNVGVENMRYFVCWAILYFHGIFISMYFVLKDDTDFKKTVDEVIELDVLKADHDLGWGGLIHGYYLKKIGPLSYFTFALIHVIALGCTIIVTLFTKSLIVLFVCLELISFFSLLFITTVNNIVDSRRIGIYFMIISGFGTLSYLLGVAGLEHVYGCTDLDVIIDKLAYPSPKGRGDDIVTFSERAIIFGLFFKLSIGPYFFIGVRVYERADWSTLYFFGLLKSMLFKAVGGFIIFGLGYATWNEPQFMVYIFFQVTLIIACIGGITQVSLRKLLGFSSALNTSLLILLLCVQPSAEVYCFFAFYLVFYGMSATAMILILFCFQNELNLKKGGPVELEDLHIFFMCKPTFILPWLICTFTVSGFGPLLLYFGKLIVITKYVEALDPYVHWSYDQFFIYVVALVCSGYMYWKLTKPVIKLLLNWPKNRQTYKFKGKLIKDFYRKEPLYNSYLRIFFHVNIYVISFLLLLLLIWIASL